jgi:lysyl-tRNA synthetase class 2
MISATKFENLAKRAELLRRLREFFHQRGFLEVETPLVLDEVIPELHIEPLRLANGQFLQASPELAMKRLLAEGAAAIFQVTHSFRAGERGKLHNPEFTMVEWYRVGDDMRAGTDLVDELMQELLGTPPAERTSYGEAFRRHASVCPFSATVDELMVVAQQQTGGSLSLDPSHPALRDRDELLNVILSARVEPQLGRERPEIIYHYPASQAALAQTTCTDGGEAVAERFELYYRGVELANGYHELADASEQRQRFEAVNVARVADGRPALPLPESLLTTLAHGLPDCTGVALGFDRLAMLAMGVTSINDVLALPAD